MPPEDEVRWIELQLVVPLPQGAGDERSLESSVVPLPQGAGDERFLEALEEACLAVSPDGFLVEGADAPPGDRAPPPPGHVRYTLYVREDAREAARARLAAVAAELPGARLDEEPLDPAWRERWKRYFRGFDVSPRLAVAPPWEARAAEGGQRVVVVEPGMAFGTGQHETTRLCLEALDALAEAGRLPAEVLDVGCGTGILALAAAHLGAERVVGLDHDPDAIACAVDNARANGLEARVALTTTPLEAVEGAFALVLANILASVLVALATPLTARLARGGRLVLSGILAPQADEVVARYEAEGLRLAGRAARGEWVRLDLERPA